MKNCFREISITEIENVKIGNAQDTVNGTGCTVILCEKGAPAGIDVRGGGPASRETELLKPTADCKAVHALLLSGGSAYGLDAAGGVMKYLEEKGIGFDVNGIRVPLVCASCLYDLAVANAKIRPDREMAYQACKNAEKNQPKPGNQGAGEGATVGKIGGMSAAMKSGLGLYAVELGALKIGAVVAVNALGDVYDEQTGKILAGMRARDGRNFADSEQAIYAAYANPISLPEGNTTIGAIITNGRFDKTQMNKIAAMAQNGLARSIRPVHTTADGDTVYALSVGAVPSDLNLTGTLAARVLAEAVKRAVLSAESAYGLPAAKDFLNSEYPQKTN